MKKNALIICEYNPFHNGHRYHLEQTRSAGAGTVICLMSGNFVQRGEIALCEKSLRAETAVRGGADLVIELPLPYVLSGARYYAIGAAKIAKALRLDATLSFGASFSLDRLNALQSEIEKPDFAQAVAELGRTAHWSFPRATQHVAEERMGPVYGALLRDPNSLLALEYLRAFHDLAPDCDFFAVRRELSCAHDAAEPSGEFASAKLLRSYFTEWTFDEALTVISDYAPPETLEVLRRGAKEGRCPLRRDLFSAVAMTRLLSIDEKQLRCTNGVRQGLEHRILSAIRSENDLFALFAAVKTKRYTHAGIRQTVLSAVLGIRRDDLEGDLPYLRVLGMNEKGRAF